jgi:hypothetical protein
MPTTPTGLAEMAFTAYEIGAQGAAPPSFVKTARDSVSGSQHQRPVVTVQRTLKIGLSAQARATR